jgi:hypothetical protein
VNRLNDIELFVEQATWLAPHLSQPTIGAFACWLAPWLRDGSKHALEALYRLNHPEQQAAESALIEVLEAVPERSAHRFVIRDDCGRNTDWPSTLALAYPFPPTRFVDQRSTDQDRGLLAGLATIGRQWSWLLTEYGQFTAAHSRAARLTAAARGFAQGPLTPAHLRRLARLPRLGDSADRLRRALELMSVPLTTPQARSTLVQLCEQLLRQGRASLDNQDDALEASVILCIARAAEGLGWRIVTAQADQIRPKPTLKLSRAKLRCAISKGKFEYPGQPKRRVVDALALLERTSLGLNSTGRQPDVVISFWNVEAPENVFFCIADAKRNESGDGVGYLKKSIVAMTAYMVAFAEPLQVQLSAQAGGLTAPVMPTATLFLRQGAHSATTKLGSRESGVLQRRDRQPWLACLDADDYAMVDGGVWQASQVGTWFAGISECASRSMHVSAKVSA